MRILIITDSYPPEVRVSSHLMKDMADLPVVTTREVGMAEYLRKADSCFFSSIYENRIKKLLLAGIL